jgi:hypothetical protein
MRYRAAAMLAEAAGGGPSADRLTTSTGGPGGDLGLVVAATTSDDVKLTTSDDPTALDLDPLAALVSALDRAGVVGLEVVGGAVRCHPAINLPAALADRLTAAGPALVEAVGSMRGRFGAVPEPARPADWTAAPGGWQRADLDPADWPAWSDLDPEPPAPCPTCGATEPWEDLDGRQRCGRCDRAVLDRALALSERAAELRRRHSAR